MPSLSDLIQSFTDSQSFRVSPFSVFPRFFLLLPLKNRERTTDMSHENVTVVETTPGEPLGAAFVCGPRGHGALTQRQCVLHFDPYSNENLLLLLVSFLYTQKYVNFVFRFCSSFPSSK